MRPAVTIAVVMESFIAIHDNIESFTTFVILYRPVYSDSCFVYTLLGLTVIWLFVLATADWCLTHLWYRLPFVISAIFGHCHVANSATWPVLGVSQGVNVSKVAHWNRNMNLFFSKFIDFHSIWQSGADQAVSSNESMNKLVVQPSTIQCLFIRKH